MSVNMPQSPSLLMNIPGVLKSKNNWVNWGVDKKNIKCPYDPKDLTKASAGNPVTWGTYVDTVNNVKSGKALGVGFEFDGSGIYGIDLDSVRDPDTGYIAPEAAEIIEALNCYCEISPSGYGLHLFCFADVGLTSNKTALPPNAIKRLDIDSKTGTPKLDKDGNPKYKNPEIEIYCDKRFFTMTGNVYDKVKDVERRPAELQQIYDKYLKPQPNETQRQPPVISGDYEDDRKYLNMGLRNGTNLISIWNGNRPSNDESVNDKELINKLAYWCNGMVPEKTILVGSRDMIGSVLYGAVTTMDEPTQAFVTYEGRRVPDSWTTKNPDQRILRISSKPLPVPRYFDGWYVAQVLA